MDEFSLECILNGAPFEVSISKSVHEYLNQYCCGPEFLTEFKRRSHLFIPINKPRYLEKVGNGEIDADVLIWDLEDSIPTDQKQLARESIKRIPPKSAGVEYNVRINVGAPSELAADIEAISNFPFDSITLPKGESAAEISSLIEAIGIDKNYIVTIETINGLNALDEIASVLRKGRDGLGFGVGDMSTDLELARISTIESPIFQQILGMITMAGKRYGLDLFDSVSAKFNEIDYARREAQLSRDVFGFTGKKLINPKQIEVINSVFTPKAFEVKEYMDILECFLGSRQTNAQVIGGEYKGLPAFKKADNNVKKYLRQGYLGLR
jgi:citrate lyase subunit beta/citryl-CoA lyase